MGGPKLVAGLQLLLLALCLHVVLVAAGGIDKVGREQWRQLQLLITKKSAS